jgi:hypothetical protein
MYELHLGDCLDVMRGIPDKSVDMVLADLPYGTTQNMWDSVIPLAPLWSQYHRICSGAVVLTSAQPFTSILVMSNIKNFKYDWVWKKPKGTGHLNAKRQPMRDKEDILVFSTSKTPYFPQMTPGTPFGDKRGRGTTSYGSHSPHNSINVGTRYPKQVLEYGVVGQGGKHPTQKPVALMEYLIQTYSLEGQMVLDNTMGSGTTGVACMNTGRKFIGIEVCQEYFDIADKRINEAHTIAILK